MNKLTREKTKEENMEGLLQTLLADLGKTYDPDAALKFLKILETEGHQNAKQIAAQNLENLLKDPPNEDATLHVIYKTPYVLGEIVLSGKRTRETHPLCKLYPIHFKKTYLKEMSRWETNPSHEATQSHKIWKHFQESQQNTTEETKPTVPLPLGSSSSTYRSQLLEAKSLGALSPINSNASQEELSKQILSALKTFGSVLPLWKGLEGLNQKVATLHEGGFLHNDLHKENLLLRQEDNSDNNHTLGGCLIDFETSEEDERFNTLEWNNATKNDKRYLLKEACLIFLCANTKEQSHIIKTSPMSKEIIEKLQTDPLLIGLQKTLGTEINPLKYTPENKKVNESHKNANKGSNKGSNLEITH